MPPTFENWTGKRELSSLGTNAGASPLAFQSWRHFKEAFAPELVARAVAESSRPVRRCLDPFGGSGTTALACQFLGVHPVTIEVNPYLSDLIAAKLANYDLEALAADSRTVVEAATSETPGRWPSVPGPPTLIEPGVAGRWVFDQAVAEGVLRLRRAIEQLSNEDHRRLFRVLLGAQLVALSNIRISGKGRRYRGAWAQRRTDPEKVVESFVQSLAAAARDVAKFRGRKTQTYEVINGDARRCVEAVENIDLAVFSPPYPNSFDYTDVYNIELWMLGYLNNKDENATLRRSTLSSHVQLSRAFLAPPRESPLLTETLEELILQKHSLWHRDIPAMIGSYFAELRDLLTNVARALTPGGRVYMVVGDSKYSGVTVPVAAILSQIAKDIGYRVVESEASRSMRASAQQGGTHQLPETLLVLT